MFAMVSIVACAAAPPPTRFEYPDTRKVDQVDTYHGTQVADPYRWLEDDNSAETAKWVEAQNKVTFAYLEKIPFRAQLRTRLERLYDYPKYSAPSRKRDLFFFYKNDGLQNQSVLYVQQGIDGKPEVLLDPNAWSSDGTVRLLTFSPSKDAQVRGVRHVAERFRLAGVQGSRSRDAQAAYGQARVGESLERRLARRRVLLQPLSRSRSGQGALLVQCEPPRVLSPAWHASVGR